MISPWLPAALAGVLLSPVHPGIDAFLDRTVPHGPGGTVAVARHGTLVHCAGFGLADREKKTPAGCDTAYDVMSITKQFTAAAIMKLQMAGKLRTTDPISVHLGRVPADKRRITLRHLLTHTSGLTDLGDDYDPVGRDTMVRRALASPLRSAPGAAFHYSNLGYSLLAAVVERVSGSSYERFLDDHLFAPAGMRSTGYVLPRWAPGQIAVEYDRQGRRQGRPTDHPWAADGPHWYLRGNGGMLSTARDLYRWHRALNGDVILSRRAKAEMFRARVLVDRTAKLSYGYGWGVFPRTEFGRVVEHDGGNDWSYGDLARSLDKGTMVFWITNHAYRKGRWNLEDLNGALTKGLLRLADADPL
ncbi:serine hydrolase domain-containing protein [Herbidospora daliensis]|uniref:serine hydrolase domain-containing protein n=1 Tax=Herbidospora daliensis TaxID=295585 RepID=UPI000780B39C|nr:serine hydrolase domain-containing protein [Herbidospora daliensis]